MAHLFIEDYGICYFPAETLPKSQVGLFYTYLNKKVSFNKKIELWQLSHAEKDI